MEQMILSEGILFASPIYFWGFSSQIKTLIDRGYSLVTNYHKPGHTSLLEGKRIGLLVTGGGVYKENAEAMFTAFGRIVDFFLARKSGELYVGECSVPAALLEEVKKKAQKLARSMVEGVETV
jgi:multimeric flavodoxin WrbA